MSAELKKRLILARELFEAPVGAFFQKLGYELSDNFEAGQTSDEVIVLDDFLPELNLPRIKSSSSSVFEPEIEKNVRGCFDQTMLENPEVYNLLRSQFSGEIENDFIERYSKQLKKVFVLKIQDYLNVGYFIDSMIIEAYRGQFNYDQMRTYLNGLFAFALKEIEKNPDQQYIDVSYSFTEQAFAVQVSFARKDFKLAEDMAPQSEQFKFLATNANFFDLNFFSKRERLTLSVLWFKEPALKKFHSYFLNETSARIVEATNLEVHSGLEEKEAIVYSARDQGKKLTLARKIALFTKNYRRNEDAPKPTDKLEILDIEYYMSLYPRQDAMVEIDDEIKAFILKLVKDDNLYNGISEFVKKIAETGIDNQTQDIQRILAGKSLLDLEETLLINGQKEDLGGGFTRVKGQAEEADGHKQVISGVTQDLSNNDKWELTKNQLNEKIEEEVTRIKSEGRNVLQDDIVKVVSSQLAVSEDNVKIIVGGLVEEAVSNTLVKGKKLDSVSSAISETNALIDNANKKKLEEQVTYMKQQMEQMRMEIFRLKEEKSAPATSSLPVIAGSDVAADTLKLKTALAKTISIMKSKDRLSEKMKLDSEAHARDKEAKIAALEERIQGIKGDYAKSADFANVEKLYELEAENKSLLSKLELANKKINIISDNMDIKENGEIVKKDKELSTLKTSIQMAQVLIERFKSEKIELEGKLQIEKELSRKIRDEYESKLKGLSLPNQAEIEEEIQSLMIEKKALEEKSKAQSNEIKKLEQKLKFTVSQLESSNKKKDGQGNQKSNEAYIKQLDVASKKMAEMNADMAEKKKELIKVKQENSALTNKVAELEKKLGSADKKAA